MTMIEKMARAMVMSREAISPEDTYVGFSPDALDAALRGVTVDGAVDFVALARAALQAIREPDVRAVVAGWEREADGLGPAFTAMIDHILNEGAEGGT
ncbi:MAG: hypothetical protein V7672_00790 [Brevundimonas sp.]|uniref:hypothetical protein n=1 Tax=Brevundimonas sp. TaxID=1871086 RepID=UPI0030039C5C